MGKGRGRRVVVVYLRFGWDKQQVLRFALDDQVVLITWYAKSLDREDRGDGGGAGDHRGAQVQSERDLVCC